MNAEQRAILEDELNGCHGQSERRVVAQFILDALDGNDDGPTPLGLCQSLTAAAETIRRRLLGQTASDRREPDFIDIQDPAGHWFENVECYIDRADDVVYFSRDVMVRLDRSGEGPDGEPSSGDRRWWILQDVEAEEWDDKWRVSLGAITIRPARKEDT